MQRGSFRTLMFGVLSFAVLGCGSSSGFLRDSITTTRIEKAGFMIVKPAVSASAVTGSALCFIPVDDGQVYRRVMEELHSKARLGPNQMLINIREDVSSISYLFYCTRTHTVSADVIEFAPENASVMQQPQPQPMPQPNYAIPPR